MQFNSTTRAPRPSRIAGTAMAAAIALALASCGGNGTNSPDSPASPPAATPPAVKPATYVVSGKVSGLAGQGLVLRNNAGDDLAISADGDFTFATPLSTGNAYAVTVGAQPVNPAQVCTVTHGSGAIGSSNITDVSVVCASHGFTVGGTVTGLSGSGLVLQNNGGDDLPVAADGSFVFPGLLADGGAYSVTVRIAPSLPVQTCSISHGSGTLAGAGVTDVSITCATPMPRFLVVANSMSGNLSPNFFSTPGFPTPVGSPQNAGGSITALAATPDGKFIYGVNSSTMQVQGYAVGPSGGLTAIPGATVPTGSTSEAIAMHPNGHVVYTADQSTAGVSAFAIDVAGGLVPLPGSPFPAGGHPSGIAVSPDGKYLYVVNAGDGTVSGYALDAATGNPTGPLPGSPFVSGSGSNAIVINPAGTRVYLTSLNADRVDVLSLDRSTGQLAPIGAIPTGADPYALAMHPSGKYLYVAAYNANTVETYNVDASSGLLTFSGSTSGFSSPSNVVLDKSGLYLFVTNGPTMNITSLAIDQTTGLPSSITTVGSLGMGPRGMVVISE